MAVSRPSGSFDILPTLAGRAKALGLAVLYFAVDAGALVGLTYGLPATGLVPAGDALSLPQQALQECTYLASAVLALVVLAVLTRESMWRWGFAMPSARRNFPIGLATGFALMAGTLGAIALLRGCEFSGVAAPFGQIVSAAVFYALLDLAVGLFEETFFRSFILVQLSRAVVFWPAAVVTAVLFGLAHGGNLNEAPFGL